jgi:hypothetical protein
MILQAQLLNPVLSHQSHRVYLARFQEQCYRPAFKEEADNLGQL